MLFHLYEPDESSDRLLEAIASIHAVSKVHVPRGKASLEEEQVVVQLHTAFALIDEVSGGSPAEAAGLRVGDEVCKFGAVCLQEPRLEGHGSRAGRTRAT